MVRSPVAVTDVLAPVAAASPNSIGAVNLNVAVGNCLVPSAPRAGPSRRELLVVSLVMSASIDASVTVVPAIVIAPVTAGVGPTGVVDPMLLSSSLTRKPTNVPVESSKLNSPTVSSTAQLPSMPLGAAAETVVLLLAVSTVSAVSTESAVATVAVGVGAVSAVAAEVWTALTAASRLTGGGAALRRGP